MTDEKLQKILARAGYGSRRQIEQMIEQGLVQVNGRTAKLGDRANDQAQLSVRGQKVKASRLEQQPTQVIAYHKPEGLICSRHDEQGRDSIFSQLPKIINGRWISIGRLDLNTSGLLLLTNNGELANRMMHPSYEVEREYAVRVFGEVTEAMLTNLRTGVTLDDGVSKFDYVGRLPSDEEAQNQWFRVILREGKYREVRRLWEAQGVKVSRLIRVRYGDISLPKGLRRGKTEMLNWVQVNKLLKAVALPEEERPDLRHRPEAAARQKRVMAERAKRSAKFAKRRR
ncbi:23S rRNA pseudouridine(2605) synthase RluB [Thiomicrospira sp. ALE5]|uniref:23S rRNA pseudouridine(2605) synthase RluB n=1 Tax=Thiomicrospira sp. ALE5 TaxID=748650 RepID=UPI0008DF54AF|nr:pseudouridine synthase [Thiomicrospira sp. ALE5]SFR50224.1 23S rRNA pseudouridine2605 synthase [Thiomicrospira sp. ALE5]